MTKSKYTKPRIMLPTMLLGTVIGITVLIVGSAVVAGMIYWESMGLDSADYAVMLIVMAAVFSGCFAASMVMKCQTLIVSLGVAGTMLAVLLSITAMFFEGQFHGIPVTLVLFLGSCIAAALVCTRIQNRHKVYRKKR